MKKTHVFAFTALLSISNGARTEAHSFENVFQKLKEQSKTNSRELKSAELSVRSSGAAQYSAMSALLPQLNGQVSQTRYENQLPGNAALGMSSPIMDSSDLAHISLNAAMPLYNRSAWIGFLQSRAQKDALLEKQKIQLQSFDAELKKTLGNYILAVYRELAMGNALEAAKELLKDTRLRFELGSKSRLDLLRAESNLATLDTKRAQLFLARMTQRQTLIDFCGINDEALKNLGLDTSLGTEALVSQAIGTLANAGSTLKAVRDFLVLKPDELKAQVLGHNLQIKNLGNQESLARLRARSSMTAEWPSLFLNAAWTRQDRSIKEAFSATTGTSFGVTLSIPLFASGRLFSSYRDMNAQLEMAGIERGQNTERLVHQALLQRLQIETLSQSLKSISTLVKQNEELLRLTRKSFELQKSSSLELLSAQNDLLSSKIDFAESKIRLAEAARDFAMSVGATYE